VVPPVVNIIWEKTIQSPAVKDSVVHCVGVLETSELVVFVCDITSPTLPALAAVFVAIPGTAPAVTEMADVLIVIPKPAVTPVNVPAPAVTVPGPKRVFWVALVTDVEPI
jgi:hypothetical protein